MPWHYMEVNGQLHTPAVLSLEKEPMLPIRYEVQWAPPRLEKKFVPEPEIEPRFLGCPACGLIAMSVMLSRLPRPF